KQLWFRYCVQNPWQDASASPAAASCSGGFSYLLYYIMRKTKIKPFFPVFSTFIPIRRKDAGRRFFPRLRVAAGTGKHSRIAGFRFFRFRFLFRSS
ncbi:MAG: hypothetical protein IKP09_10205, partial [Lentisphaeria bacterium]|nr:hypothetical protein [Lentisphaeria bacterium]